MKLHHSRFRLELRKKLLRCPSREAAGQTAGAGWTLQGEVAQPRVGDHLGVTMSMSHYRDFTDFWALLGFTGVWLQPRLGFANASAKT